MVMLGVTGPGCELTTYPMRGGHAYVIVPTCSHGVQNTFDIMENACCYRPISRP